MGCNGYSGVVSSCASGPCDVVRAKGVAAVCACIGGLPGSRRFRTIRKGGNCARHFCRRSLSTQAYTQCTFDRCGVAEDRVLSSVCKGPI